jgi:large subunit ribosomal protein L13
MATQSAKASEIERKWYVVDAAGQPLGRLASKVAVDTGDFVIITNAAQISLSGNKLEDKYYHRHSGYPGGLHSESYGHLLERKPEFVVERAVKGMLPKNSLGRQMFRKLKVYADGTHPHVAQKPEAFPF